MDERPTIKNEQPRDLVWLFSCAAITALATFLRFYWLGIKPFHHDEGVNGFFLTNLFRDGIYKYDPANYHGPTLYYITLAFAEVFGLETIPVRWSVAIWGVLIVVLAFYLRNYIGRVGALSAAAFLALSPGMVYISRYFIHEIFFVFLGLGLVLAILLFIEKPKAGPGAVAWMSLVFLACFSPPVLRIAPALAGESVPALWSIRIGLLLVEGVLIYFVIRMLLDWNAGRPIYLLLAAACIALLFATKETTFITLGTMAIACVCVWAREKIAESASRKEFPTKVVLGAAGGAAVLAFSLYYKLPGVVEDFAKWGYERVKVGAPTNYETLVLVIIAGIPPLLAYLLYSSDSGRENGLKTEPGIFRPSLAAFRENLGAGADRTLLLAASSALIVYLIVLFFSSFFTYAEGVKGFFEAYAIWVKTGSKDHAENGVWAYVDWGMKSDGPILVLSLIGLIIALIKGSNRFAMFVTLWAFGLFAAYTIIPYKTPWLALSFLLPMCIAAGYAINELVTSKVNSIRAIGGVLAVSSLAVLAYLTYDLNFVRFDDEDAPMVYAHTQREFLDMVREIERFAEASGKAKEASIDVVSPDYWPLVWYLKDYPKAIFHGRIADSRAEMIVVKKGEQDNDITRRYSSNYEYYGTYKLRSGVDLVLLVRRDVMRAAGK